MVISQRGSLLCGLLGAVLAFGVAGSGQAAPGGPQDAASAGTRDGTRLKAQLKDVDARLASERARNARLQAQVARMEQQNADREQRLQQRDDKIAALQETLRASDAPAAAASVDP